MSGMDDTLSTEARDVSISLWSCLFRGLSLHEDVKLIAGQPLFGCSMSNVLILAYVCVCKPGGLAGFGVWPWL